MIIKFDFLTNKNDFVLYLRKLLVSRIKILYKVDIAIAILFLKFKCQFCDIREKKK